MFIAPSSVYINVAHLIFNIIKDLNKSLYVCFSVNDRAMHVNGKGP